MKTVALLYLVPEGVNTWVAGVGSVINGNLNALPAVVRRMKSVGVDLRLHFATPAATPAVRGWNPAMLAKATDVAEATGGRVILLPNQTDGSDNFGTLDNWKVVSAAGAGLAYELARHVDRTVVLAHSAHPFALAPVYIDMQADTANVDITTVLVLHSTAIQDRTFPFKGGKHPDQARIMVEALAIHWAKFTDRIKIGCISDYMARHLTSEYGARADCLVPTRNGIDTNNPIFDIRPQERRLDTLRRFGVPTDRPLIFSWGRFVPEKGFDVFLDVASRLDGALHPVLVGMVDHSPEYPGQIIEWSQSLPGERTIIVERDWELVTSILQHPNTKLVGIFSRYDEPFGLVVNPSRSRTAGMGSSPTSTTPKRPPG
jgi:glycosyltransferase involved in cell wall biosynthesis